MGFVLGVIGFLVLLNILIFGVLFLQTHKDDDKPLEQRDATIVERPESQSPMVQRYTVQFDDSGERVLLIARGDDPLDLQVGDHGTLAYRGNSLESFAYSAAGLNNSAQRMQDDLVFASSIVSSWDDNDRNQ